MHISAGSLCHIFVRKLLTIAQGICYFYLYLSESYWTYMQLKVFIIYEHLCRQYLFYFCQKVTDHACSSRYLYITNMSADSICVIFVRKLLTIPQGIYVISIFVRKLLNNVDWPGNQQKQFAEKSLHVFTSMYVS